VLYVAEGLDRTWSQKEVWAIIESLERQGMRVTLLTTPKDDGCNLRQSFSIVKARSKWSMIMYLLTKAWQYDAVITYVTRSYAVMLPIIKMLTGIRYVLKSDGFIFSPGQMGELIPGTIWWRVRFADLLLVESPRIRESFARIVPRRNMLLCPNSVFERKLSKLLQEFSHKAGQKDSRHIILFVGRIVPSKGVHLLVSSFRSLANEFPDWHLVLVGLPKDTHYVSSIARSINEAPLRGRVHVIGYVDDADLHRFFYEADILCLPSYSEGSSNVIPRAMFFSNAIVASDVGETPYQLDEGRCGLLFERGSEKQLEECLRRLMSDVDLRGTLGSRARHRVLQLFTWERNMEGFLQRVLTVL